MVMTCVYIAGCVDILVGSLKVVSAILWSSNMLTVVASPVEMPRHWTQILLRVKSCCAIVDRPHVCSLYILIRQNEYLRLMYK